MNSQEKIKHIINVLCSKRNNERNKEKNLLDILVATILSQNTNDILSFKAYSNLKTSLNKWDDLLYYSEKRIANKIKIAGLSNQKSKTIKNVIRYLKNTYGKVELEFIKNLSNEEIFNEFEKIKGIGKKTIACLILFGLRRNIFPVDTHIHRICNRLGLVNTKNATETFLAMNSLIPKGKEYCLHIAMIQFGRDICKAQKPECYKCKLIDYCNYDDKNFFQNVINPNIKNKKIIILNKI